MIPFKPIEIGDKAAIESFTLRYAPANCDLAFANMYCWQFRYRSSWTVIDDFLIIRFYIDGGSKLSYMQAVGSGDFTPVLRRLEEDALAAGQPLRIVCLTAPGIETLLRSDLGEFAFDENREMADYVYNASDLRELPGRKYQPKRNHIRRFKASYDYRYEEMTPAHAAECMRLENQWRRRRQDHPDDLTAEQVAMKRAFDHFDELGLRGGCLYADGRLVAFTYGSPINGQTFCIHAEKADTDYEGAFAVINQEFASRLPECYTLINREEDLGIEGLRRAKLSYHPAFLQPKVTALLLGEDEAACKQLWLECFGDDEQFIDSFLIRHYDRQHMLTAEEEGRIVAMLHLIPFQSELGRTTYIYGVATDPACRDRGYASTLLCRALELIDDRGDDAAILIPGEERLKSFYAPFGFADAGLPVTFDTADGFDFGSGSPETDLAMVRLRNPAATLPEQLHCRPRPEPQAE